MRRPARTAEPPSHKEKNMDLQLTDRVVVLTGAAAGIGQATARLLTEEGAIVVGVDRDPIDTGRGARDTAVQADLTDPATPDRVTAIVLEQHGRIDALVNNAGGLQARTSFLDVTDEQWLATFNLNFHAARRMSRAAVTAMLASGGGSLVHLGSDSALRPPGRLRRPGRQDVGHRQGNRDHPHGHRNPATAHAPDGPARRHRTGRRIPRLTTLAPGHRRRMERRRRRAAPHLTHHQQGQPMNKPVTDPHAPRTSPLAGQVIAENFAGWSAEIRREFADNAHNHRVGSVLLSETDQVKVWSIRLAPGERVPAHRHVLNYFWTALTEGISLQHTDDGTTRRVVYRAGETRHFSFPGDEYILHDLYNDGPSELAFLTVEHKSERKQD